MEIETNRNNYLRKFNEEISADLARAKKEQERLQVVETKNLQLLDDGEQKMVFLSEENDKLKEEFGIRINNYDTIKRELEKIKNGNSDVIDKISDLTTKNSQLLGEKSELKSEIQNGLAEFEILRKKYEDVVSENELYENEIKTSSTDLISAQENFSLLESDLLQKFSSEKTEFLKKIENLSSEILTLTKSNSDATLLKGELKKAENLQKQLENENLELIRGAEHLKTGILENEDLLEEKEILLSNIGQKFEEVQILTKNLTLDLEGSKNLVKEILAGKFLLEKEIFGLKEANCDWKLKVEI